MLILVDICMLEMQRSMEQLSLKLEKLVVGLLIELK